MLSTSAFNALLKILEEPPGHVVFIFATTEPHKIPMTVLSRTQRFDYKRIAVSEIVRHLQKISEAEGITVSPAALLIIAREAQGSMRDSQSLLDQIIGFAGTNIAVELYERPADGSGDAVRVEARQITVYEEVFQWFLIPSVALLLVAFGLPERGWVRRRRAR